MSTGRVMDPLESYLKREVKVGRHNSVLTIGDRKEAAKSLVMQYRIERATKRMSVVGLIIFVLAVICGIIAPFRPDHFYGT